MSFELLLEPLRRVPLFQGLRPIQIAEIARRAERVVFQAGDTIIQEDRAGDAAFLIISGEAVRTRGPVPSEPVPIGSLLGEMAMLVETTYTSTVVCTNSVRVLKLTRENLHDLMLTDLRLAEHFVAKLSYRLRAFADDLKRVDQALAAESPPVATMLPARIPTLQPVDASFQSPL